MDPDASQWDLERTSDWFLTEETDPHPHHQSSRELQPAQKQTEHWAKTLTQESWHIKVNKHDYSILRLHLKQNSQNTQISPLRPKRVRVPVL